MYNEGDFDKTFKYPSFDKSILNYNKLDAIFKFIEDDLYTDLPRHTSQAVLKEVNQKWKDFFSSLKDFKSNPSKYL